ncbi:hypothetical protein HDU76_009816 [Blyttiomyces sp. JEL0837]|nr:hypothetical protein HDU76_009816 [Blyttiomyces sp. JEL0837]
MVDGSQSEGVVKAVVLDAERFGWAAEVVKLMEETEDEELDVELVENCLNFLTHLSNANAAAVPKDVRTRLHAVVSKLVSRFSVAKGGDDDDESVGLDPELIQKVNKMSV